MSPSIQDPDPTMNAPETVRYRRRIKLIQPTLQFKLIGAFAGVATVALLGEFLVIAALLLGFANDMPAGGDHLVGELPRLVFEMLAISFGILLPCTVGIGILFTFRVAGPIYRFEQHLRAVVRGEDPGPCRIRETDHFQDLCVLINEAFHGARRHGAPDEERHEGSNAA